MILVIDAYNILKQISSNQYINDAQRRAFLELLGLYGKIKNHKIVVVFDGGPYDRTFKVRRCGVYVVYSGTQETADDYIRRYLDEYKAYDILLISSDRSLNAWANRLNIEYLDSIDFYTLICKETIQKKEIKARSKSCLVKTSTQTDDDLDSLMEQAADHGGHKIETLPDQERKPPARKMSKKERMMAKKITKL